MNHSIEKQPVVVQSRDAQHTPRTKHVIPNPYFRALADRMLTLRSDSHAHKLIGVASCSHREGNSTIASNLAVALTDAVEGEVLLVDCVGTSRAAPKRKCKMGWFDIAFGDSTVMDVLQTTDRERLFVVSAGQPYWQDNEVYSRERLKEVAESLRERFEFTIFDLPCADEMSGCLSIGSVLDGVIINMKAGATNSSRALRFQKDLAYHGANVIGVVLNETKSYVPKLLRSFLGLKNHGV